MNCGKKEVRLGAIGNFTMMMQTDKKRISIITPCFNEEENIKDCILAVRKTMTEELPEFDYEHIFIWEIGAIYRRFSRRLSCRS